MIREKNSTAFINAISTLPQAFAHGFDTLEKAMGILHCESLLLWPRYREEVQIDLERVRPKVTEVHIPLTSLMQEMQLRILSLMKLVLREAYLFAYKLDDKNKKDESKEQSNGIIDKN